MEMSAFSDIKTRGNGQNGKKGCQQKKGMLGKLANIDVSARHVTDMSPTFPIKPVEGDDLSWRRWPLDAVAIDNKVNKQVKKIKQTHHHINQLGYGLDEGPYPFTVGLWVNGPGRRANNGATWALLGVYLHKV